MSKGWIKALAATAVAALVAACGGGGGAGGIGGTGGGGGGGIGGTGVAYGGITAFGSVWVNGVEYSSDGTTIKLDDNPSATQADLRVGMVVRVDGSIDDKKATTITVDDSIKGRVDRVIDANQIVVLGQTVQIDDSTRFETTAPGKDDYVEVHGLVVAGGTVSAGFVRKLSGAPAVFEVKGLVTSQDAAAKSLVIGTLTVDYSNATIDNTMPSGSWVGTLVEVKAAPCAASPCTTLVASKIEPSGLQVASGSSLKAEVEGYVVSGTSASFVLGTQTVVTTGSTVFEGGVAGDLVPGVKVEAEGSLAGGVLTATKVSFRDSARFEADVASYTPASGTVTLAGLPGITVKVNSLTAFKNTTQATLAVGNHLRIRGKLSATANTVVATEVEARSANTRLELQSTVTATNGSSNFTLLGITVNTGTVSTFKDVNDNAITAAQFYAALKVGSLAKARGSWNGASITWTEVQLEQ